MLALMPAGKGNGLELVLDNVLDATFIYPTNGDKVMQLAMNILEKKSYPRETVMNTAVVDRTNAHVMQLQTTHISELDQKIETFERTYRWVSVACSYAAGRDVWRLGYSFISSGIVVGSL